MKLKPKSCACIMCRWVKADQKMHPKIREMEERAFRHRQKIKERAALLRPDVEFDPAPYGDYHA